MATVTLLENIKYDVEAVVDSQAAVSRSEYFQAMVADPAAGPHFALKSDDFLIRSGYKVAPLSIRSWVDEKPTPEGAPYDATKAHKIKILFGTTGTYQTRWEIHFKVRCVGSDADTAWPAYLAERLLGAEYSVKFQNDILKTHDVHGMHFRRRLEGDFFSAKEAAYQLGVGALEEVVVTAGTRHVWCELDMGYNENKPLVPVSLAHQHQLEFTIPKIADIIKILQGTAYANNVTLGGTYSVDEVWLRCHTIEVDQLHRFNLAKFMMKTGTQYHTSEIEKAAVKEISLAKAVTESTKVSIDLSLVHPSAYLFFVCRYTADLSPAANAPADLTATPAALGSTHNIVADPFKPVVPLRWAVTENNRLLLPEVDWQYACTELQSRLFNSELLQPIGFVPFTRFPLLAHDHSLGHMVTASLTKPRLEVVFSTPNANSVTGLQNVNSLAVRASVTAASQTHLPALVSYTITVWSVCPNFLHVKNGRIFRAYN